MGRHGVPGRNNPKKIHLPMKERRPKPARPTADESTSDDDDSNTWESTDGSDSELSEWVDDDDSVNSKSSEQASKRAGLRGKQRTWRGRVRFDHCRLRKHSRT